MVKSGRSDRDAKPEDISVVIVRRERPPGDPRERRLLELLVDLLDKPDTPDEVPRP